ncbi:unnamed protein product [Cuscuta campestris]|uniref:Uncharacterized protein n=1 Tax=Cuscuta campestris TaxID=132261 RepID=A0A484NAB6_9ASTE|nr:unnamed protein product [Cuscuta campestris]
MASHVYMRDSSTATVVLLVLKMNVVQLLLTVGVIKIKGDTTSRMSGLANIEKHVLGQIGKQEYDKALAYIKACLEQCTGDSREKEEEQCLLYELCAMVYINKGEGEVALMEATLAFEIHKKYRTFFKYSEVADIFGTYSDQTEDIRAEVSAQHEEFDIIFKCTSYSTPLGGLRGSMESCGFNLPVTYVRAERSRLTRFPELRELCCCSDTLLSVIHLASIPPTSNPFILTEPAHVLENFFSLEAQSLWSQDVRKTYETWWKHIECLHRSIFRDIAQGLLFLYSRGECCGQLASNVYVTDEGRGKILPSMYVDSSPKDDLRHLVRLMKDVILQPFPGATLDDFPLPLELKRFFSFIGVGNLKKVPVWYQIYPPYFWTVRECISFVHCFKTMMFSQQIVGKLNKELLKMKFFCNSAKNLDGVFKEIWKKGDPSLKEQTKSEGVQSNSGLKDISYKGRIAIVRFARTLYVHINGDEYQHFRRKALWLGKFSLVFNILVKIGWSDN